MRLRIIKRNITLYTMFEKNLCKSEESEGDHKVGGPVDGSGDGCAGSSCPPRIDFTVDGPWHGAHTCSLANSYNGRSSKVYKMKYKIMHLNIMSENYQPSPGEKHRR